MEENCSSNSEEQLKYLDPLNQSFFFSLVYNNENFVADKYGDESIMREANYVGTYFG